MLDAAFIRPGLEDIEGVRLHRLDDEPLAAALQRNVYANEGETGCVGRLAAYVRETVGVLAAQEGESFARAELRFPDPASVLVVI